MAFWDLNAAAPDAVALVTSEKSISYYDLGCMADRIATCLKPQRLALLVARNSVASIAGYIGFLRAGVVPLMVSESISNDAALHLIEAYEPEYIWAPTEFGVSLEETSELASLKEYRLCRTSSRGLSKPNQDLAVLLPTSGSTGSPRYVRISQKNLQSNAEAIVKYLGIVPRDCAITTLPFSYSYGTSIVNSHLEAGASVAVTERSLMERDFWTFLQESKATSFGGVPYTYQMLDRLRFERMILPSLRYITQAGGHLSEQLQSKFAHVCDEKGLSFFVMYGQTEATARMSYLPPEKACEKSGSIGIAIPGGKFRVVREDDSTVELAGEQGELVYEGPNVSLGYASCRDDLAKADERNGVLRTGDIARFDEENYYYIEGRKSRFLKVFGNRVGLDDLERLLAAKGFVAACGGSDDCVEVFLEREDSKVVAKLLSELTGLSISAFKVTSVQSLPRSDSGKVLYSKLGDTL